MDTDRTSGWDAALASHPASGCQGQFLVTPAPSLCHGHACVVDSRRTRAAWKLTGFHEVVANESVLIVFQGKRRIGFDFHCTVKEAAIWEQTEENKNGGETTEISLSPHSGAAVPCHSGEGSVS